MFRLEIFGISSLYQELLVADLQFVFSSFLPQDKVSEFAHMSPQQLLRETQRAAGDSRLTNWHDTLITAGKEMAQLGEVGPIYHPKIKCAHLILQVLNSEKQQLKTLEDRNAMLERDVQRFNERKELERQVSLLLSFLSPESLTLITLDCTLGAHSPIYGIYGG